jgi:uncharacterized protein involved in exopolysaccharide biosynthesis
MVGARRLITIRDILYVFFKNRFAIIITFLTAVVAASIYCFVTPPVYRAEAKLLIKLGKAQVSGMEQYRPENYNLLFQERTQNIRNEIELIRGQYLTEKVLQRLKETDGPALARQSLGTDSRSQLTFQACLRVEFLEESDMIGVAFDWPDPKFAALVVNTYTEEYISQHMRVHQSKQSYQFYLEQISLYEKKLKDSEEELQTFLNRTGMANIALQKELLLRNIFDIENKYQESLIEYKQTAIKLDKTRELIKKNNVWIETPDVGGSKLVDRQAYLRTLDEAYFKLKIERDRLLRNFTPKANEIQSIDRQLIGIRNQKAESLLNLLNMELVITRNRKDDLWTEVAGLKKELAKTNSLTLQLRELERNREIIETNYQLYKKKGEDLRIADDLDARRLTSVRIATPALPPLEAAYPKKGLVIGLAALMGLFLGFAVSAVREYFNHTFRDDEGVSRILGVPSLLSVPYVDKTPNGGAKKQT